MRRVLHQIGWQVLSNVGVALIAAVYVLYLGASLGAAQFGLFALVLAVPTFAFAAADLRIQEATARFLVQQTNSQRCAEFLQHFWRVDLIARVLVAVVLAIATPLIFHLLLRSQGEWAMVLTASLGMFVAKAGNSPAVGVLRACDLFGWHARLLLVSWALKLGVTWLWIANFHGGVFGAIAISVGVDSAANFVTLVRARRAARSAGWLRDGERVDRSLPRADRAEVRRFLSSSLGISASDSVLRELDTALVGAMLNLEAVGVYRMGKNIVQMIWRTVDPVYIVLMPVFARNLASGNHAQVDRQGRIITLATFAVVLSIAIAMVLALPYVVPVLLGATFAGLGAVCAIMVAGVLFGGPFIWVHAAWIAEGRPDRQLIANASGAIIAASAYLLLIPRMAVTGAAIAFAISLSAPFLISRVLWLMYRRRE